MPRLMIKQLGDSIATAGLFMGGGPERRKLQPGEIVEIPEDFEPGMYEGEGLLNALWGTGKVEMTLDPATRPIDFENTREAQITSPTFKSRGPDEDIEIEKVQVAIKARMAQPSDAQPSADSPADDSQPDQSDDSIPAAVDTAPPPNRRAARRAASQALERGAEVPT